jgi:hypothetical protein
MFRGTASYMTLTTYPALYRPRPRLYRHDERELRAGLVQISDIAEDIYRRQVLGCRSTRTRRPRAASTVAAPPRRCCPSSGSMGLRPVCPATLRPSAHSSSRAPGRVRSEIDEVNVLKAARRHIRFSNHRRCAHRTSRDDAASADVCFTKQSGGSTPLILRRAILTIISGLAAITAITADVRENRAATHAYSELRPSNHKPVPESLREARPGPLARAAAPNVRANSSRRPNVRANSSRRRAQRPVFQGNAISPSPSDKAPKTRKQLSPQPRPSAKAPAPSPRTPAANAPTPALPPPSACQGQLTPDLALVRPLPSITGPNSCGGDDIVLLEAVVLEDGQRVALVPAATLRCPMAEAVVRLNDNMGYS